MNIILICSLICLSSSSVLNQLVPLNKITNKSLITISPLKKIVNNQLINVIMDHQKDPAYLLSVLSKVDPTELNVVIALIQKLLAASVSDLIALTLASTNANTAYTDATVAYNAAVTVRATLETDYTDANVLAEKHYTDANTEREIAYTAQSAVLDQHVDALFVVQTEANGAKKNAQDTLDTEKIRLDDEIKTLNDVIAVLVSLGATNSGHKVTIGRPDYISVYDQCLDPSGSCTEGLAQDSDVHAVTCCSDTLISGWSNLCGDTNVYGERDVWSEGCQTLNWYDANTFCSSKGGRLCTVEEIATNCVSGYGCQYDGWLIWTSSQ